MSANMKEAVSATQSDWVEACEKAGFQDEFFRTFRSSEAFKRVVEGTPEIGGIWNLKRLLKSKNFKRILPFIQMSDTVGLPPNKINFSVDYGKYKKEYNLSPTTIRYANNTENCLAFFGEDIFSGNIEIHEIGAGYGGECKIFNDYAKVLFNKSLKGIWNIYDLPSSFGVIEKFLSKFNYFANFTNLNSVNFAKNSDSLVISNAAFSEMTGNLLEEYFNTIILPAKKGYFITNFEVQSVPFGGWTTDDFVKRLKECGKSDVVVLPAYNYLSYFDHQAGSKLVVFGHNKNIKRDSKKYTDVILIKAISIIFNIQNIFKEYFLKDKI